MITFSYFILALTFIFRTIQWEVAGWSLFCWVNIRSLSILSKKVFVKGSRGYSLYVVKQTSLFLPLQMIHWGFLKRKVNIKKMMESFHSVCIELSLFLFCLDFSIIALVLLIPSICSMLFFSSILHTFSIYIY